MLCHRVNSSSILKDLSAVIFRAKQDPEDEKYCDPSKCQEIYPAEQFSIVEYFNRQIDHHLNSPEPQIYSW